MKLKHNLYIVEETALPEVFVKVIEVNGYLDSGKYKSISDATEKAGISRSAYYKYKDKIKPFRQLSNDAIITFSCTVLDEPGVLSDVISNFAKCGANILTINQSIPANKTAVVIISARTGDMKNSVETMIKKAKQIDGVVKFDILSSES